MSNVRDLGHKISSLKNMQKVTGAMNMISSIKLRKYMAHLGVVNNFLKKTETICGQIAFNLMGCDHPAVRGHKKISKTHIIVFTADKGLCGSHNSGILKAVENFTGELNAKGIAAEFTCLGIKAINWAVRENRDLIGKEEMNDKTLTREALKSIADVVYARFLSGDVQQVLVFGKIFRSTLQQDTQRKTILPLPAPEDGSEMPAEPFGDQLAESWGRIYLRDILRGYALHSFLSEHSARLTAMENATKNSEDLIGKYMTMLNHARQAAITNELIEIVSGKEALKGQL